MNIDTLFLKGDLIPVIVQHAYTREVLMLAYADKTALKRTIETKKACFYSRSRQAPWMKGETSGNYISVCKIETDCDNDTLIYHGYPTGPVCHTGNPTCFYTTLWEEKEK